MARLVGIGHINMDVIAGLPGEHLEDFARTMEGAMQLRPESLTVHTLAIKRTSRLQIERWPLPDGGISKRVFPEEGHIERQPNVSNIDVYLERYAEMAQKKRALFLS